jgi:hypothetical protein
MDSTAIDLNIDIRRVNGKPAGIVRVPGHEIQKIADAAYPSFCLHRWCQGYITRVAKEVRARNEEEAASFQCDISKVVLGQAYSRCKEKNNKCHPVSPAMLPFRTFAKTL